MNVEDNMIAQRGKSKKREKHDDPRSDKVTKRMTKGQDLLSVGLPTSHH